MSAGFGAMRSGTDETAQAVSVWLRSFTTKPTQVSLIDPTGWIQVDDVVFGPTDEVSADQPEHSSEHSSTRSSEHASNPWREIGFVSSVDVNDSLDSSAVSGNRVVVTVFDPDRWTTDATMQVHRCTGRIDEVLATLLPEDRRAALQVRLAAAMEAHLAEVTDAVLPLVMQSLQASVPLIEQGIVDSVSAHREEIDGLMSKYRSEIIQDRIVPLVRQEVIPIVRRHGQEPAEAIGREIWGKASLWRFGWRAIYDKSPLPERELVQEEWQRFVDQEVVPTMEDHLDEITDAVELILRDLVRNERIRDELVAVVETVSDDDEARTLFRTMVAEAVIDNEALHRVWTEVWSSPDAKNRLRIAGKRIEPILRQIGDEVMGTREGGIEPGFARVLRNQILGKDRSWITVRPGVGLSSTDQIPRLTKAESFMPYPVVHLANPDP